MKTALKKLQGHDINGKKIKLSIVSHRLFYYFNESTIEQSLLSTLCFLVIKEKVGGSRSRSRSKDRR
jgi:hypothetical protein